MYFTIIRDNGFVKPFILSFSEIEEVSINESYSTFTYYKLSIKGLRKIKLSILNNVELKESFITLQGLLNDKRFIKKYDNVPEPSYKVIGYNGYSFIYGHSYSIKYMDETTTTKQKLNTKNISYKNRFFGKVNKKVDFHKSNYKRK